RGPRKLGYQRNREKESVGRRGLPELLLVALFDLLHEGAAAEEVRAQAREDGLWNDCELVADHLGKVDGTPRRYEMSAPLKHEAEVPKNEGGERDGSGEFEDGRRRHQMRCGF